MPISSLLASFGLPGGRPDGSKANGGPGDVSVTSPRWSTPSRSIGRIGKRIRWRSRGGAPPEGAASGTSDEKLPPRTARESREQYRQDVRAIDVLVYLWLRAVAGVLRHPSYRAGRTRC